MIYDTIIIGGGQAGLAMGYTLRQANVSFLILEANQAAVGSWRNTYASLKLFSPIRYSSLPGLAFPGELDSYPTRDQVIDYLQQYAHHFQLPIITNAPVKQVVGKNNRFQVETNNGTLYQARTIVAATGSFRKPSLPIYPNQDGYRGTILHSSAYRQPDPFAGKQVVVVGAKNSALQIAVELAQSASVTLAARSPVNLAPQMIGGKDIHFWAKWTGLDTLPFGHRPKLMQKVLDESGTIDIGGFKEALASGNPNVRPMFERFTEQGVIWQDGEQTPVDAVIFATGFRPNLDYLAPLNALDHNGNPQHRLGTSSTVEGLYYMGLAGQRSLSSATIRGVGRDAKLIGQHIERYLAGQPCCRAAAISQRLSRFTHGSIA